jgi:hypothetical protein
MKVRQLIMQALNFCMVAASALMIWRCIMIVCNTEAPMVVVLSGSMEPSMYRGDILVLYKKDVLKIGDTTQIQIENEKIAADEKEALDEVSKEENEIEEKRTKDTLNAEEKADADNNEIKESKTEKELDLAEEKEQLLQQ